MSGRWPTPPADDSLASVSVVTVSVPTMTLMSLTPGTAYSVRVRGLCDIGNCSPWSNTLQFATTTSSFLKMWQMCIFFLLV